MHAAIEKCPPRWRRLCWGPAFAVAAAVALLPKLSGGSVPSTAASWMSSLQVTPAREKTLAEWDEALAIVQRTLELWKGTIDSFPEEVATFSN